MTTTPTPLWTDSGQGDLLALVAVGPMAPDTADREWDLFLEAVRTAAGMRAGTVDQNDVRPRIRGHIAPKRIGAFYSRACARGLLVADSWSTSTDAEGRNAGRPMRCYRWIGGAL